MTNVSLEKVGVSAEGNPKEDNLFRTGNLNLELNMDWDSDEPASPATAELVSEECDEPSKSMWELYCGCWCFFGHLLKPTTWMEKDTFFPDSLLGWIAYWIFSLILGPPVLILWLLCLLTIIPIFFFITIPILMVFVYIYVFFRYRIFRRWFS